MLLPASENKAPWLYDLTSSNPTTLCILPHVGPSTLRNACISHPSLRSLQNPMKYIFLQSFSRWRKRGEAKTVSCPGPCSWEKTVQFSSVFCHFLTNRSKWQPITLPHGRKITVKNLPYKKKYPSHKSTFSFLFIFFPLCTVRESLPGFFIQPI